MKNLVVYVHGKGGSAQEAEHYKSLFPKDEVIGFDYRSQTPWQAKKEFFAFFTEQRGRCEHLTLVANSIGAYFALSSLDETLVDRAYQGLSYLSDCGYGELDLQYDAMVECNRTGACRETGNRHEFRRNAVMGVSLLCAQASDDLECPHLYSLR